MKPYWNTTEWVFFGFAATGVMTAIITASIWIFMEVAPLEPADYKQLDRFTYIPFSICIISCLVSITIWLTFVLAYWQEKINKKKKLFIYDEVEPVSENAENKVVIPSPLKGKALEKEEIIIHELCRRGKKQDGSLNRAPVAQLLKALIDMHWLVANTSEKDELMLWVVQETGYRETNVSAFNEAISNATDNKVDTAKKWLLAL